MSRIHTDTKYGQDKSGEWFAVTLKGSNADEMAPRFAAIFGNSDYQYWAPEGWNTGTDVSEITVPVVSAVTARVVPPPLAPVPVAATRPNADCYCDSAYHPAGHPF